jgi:hypothetical protein
LLELNRCIATVRDMRRSVKEEMMVVNFAITDLQARVDEPLKVTWRDRDFDPGPLKVELDSSAGNDNAGTLDFDNRRAQAEFHVLLSFPEFAEALEGLGADHELTQPARVVIHSEGEILDDHSFRLSGPCDLEPHALLNDTRASVLPGI